MKKFIYTGTLAFALLFSAASLAQTKSASSKKQEDPKKKTAAQDTTKKPGGTRMAINSQGLPTKGTKSSTSSNRTVSDPKKEEAKSTKKENSPK